MNPPDMPRGGPDMGGPPPPRRGGPPMFIRRLIGFTPPLIAGGKGIPGAKYCSCILSASCLQDGR